MLSPIKDRININNTSLILPFSFAFLDFIFFTT